MSEKNTYIDDNKLRPTSKT